MNRTRLSNYVCIITCHEPVIWLCDYVNYSLCVWLWLWLCWLDWVSHSDIYIGSSVTYRHIYWVGCHIWQVSRTDTYIWSGVSFFNKLTFWVWVPRDNHLWWLCPCILVFDMGKRYVAPKRIIDLYYSYMSVLLCRVYMLYVSLPNELWMIRPKSGCGIVSGDEGPGATMWYLREVLYFP